ncbi:MAG: TonB family protein [Pseudomonadota bacterium]
MNDAAAGTLAAEATGFVDRAPPIRDRMTTAVFMVAIFHLIVILGVTFGGPDAVRTDAAPSLEVLVVHDPVVDPAPNEDADYLAQVNQRGSGTSPDARGAASPRSAVSAAERDGDPDASGADAAGDRAVHGDPDVVATRANPADARRFAADATRPRAGAPLVLLPASEASGADEGEELSLRGRTERELLVTANTRESSVAVYLHAWRRRIERVGTMNYPLGAIRRERMSGNPVLEVQLLADGRLGTVAVRRSSGVPELDNAAVSILKLASPFEPFPASLAARHDALRLAYEWQFIDGDFGGSSVRVPANTR